MYWRITRDLLHESDPEGFAPSQVGAYYTEEPVEPRGTSLIRFRLLDDDRIPYYEGVGDDEGLDEVFAHYLYDSGCTMLEVMTPDGWRLEIG